MWGLGRGGAHRAIAGTVTRSSDGYRLGVEVLIDAYLAARCQWFVGDGASGVSCAIAHLKEWPSDALHLVRQNVFAERHFADVPGWWDRPGTMASRQ